MNIFIDSINGDKITITGGDVMHLKVLRHKAGDRFRLVETTGNKYADSELIRIDKKEAEFKVIKLEDKPQKKHKIVLYQAVIKKSNLELVIQKATELGVDSIGLVLTDRVSEKGHINLERCNIIAREAAMQSERFDVPTIESPIKLTEIVGKKDLFCLGERSHVQDIFAFLSQNISKLKEISVLVGPEGGFSSKEIVYIKEKKVPIISFGSEILRSETAAIASLSVIKSFCLTNSLIYDRI